MIDFDNRAIFAGVVLVLLLVLLWWWFSSSKRKTSKSLPPPQEQIVSQYESEIPEIEEEDETGFDDDFEDLSDEDD